MCILKKEVRIGPNVTEAVCRRVILQSGSALTGTTTNTVTQKMIHTLRMRVSGTATWDGCLMTAKHKKE